MLEHVRDTDVSSVAGLLKKKSLGYPSDFVYASKNNNI